MKYFFGSMRPMPASQVMNVRTNGTNRASTTALGPCFSRKSCVLCTYSCLKNRESGRLNSFGPAFQPIA